MSIVFVMGSPCGMFYLVNREAITFNCRMEILNCCLVSRRRLDILQVIGSARFRS